MTTLETLTTGQIETLRNECGEAGDMETVALCNIALRWTEEKHTAEDRREAREAIVEIIAEYEREVAHEAASLANGEP